MRPFISDTTEKSRLNDLDTDGNTGERGRTTGAVGLEPGRGAARGGCERASRDERDAPSCELDCGEGSAEQAGDEPVKSITSLAEGEGSTEGRARSGNKRGGESGGDRTPAPGAGGPTASG